MNDRKYHAWKCVKSTSVNLDIFTAVQEESFPQSKRFKKSDNLKNAPYKIVSIAQGVKSFQYLIQLH